MADELKMLLFTPVKYTKYTLAGVGTVGAVMFVYLGAKRLLESGGAEKGEGRMRKVKTSTKSKPDQHPMSLVWVKIVSMIQKVCLLHLPHICRLNEPIANGLQRPTTKLIQTFRMCPY